MSYLVLARKWRPQKFDEVVGQAHVTRTLANAIEADRVAHSFVFSGVRGVGKTSLARILAKSLNCERGPTLNPCGECDSCRSIAAGTNVDVIEIDGASNNSVDDIRELRETVPYRPVIGRYKIYVIDEVHMLSVSAFNALLKTLEEPPPHVKFIFATTEAHKIPVTILSRCQRYDFRRIPTAAIVDRIRTILDAEGIEAEEKALSLIGREAEGSMRDALSVLDQVLAEGATTLTRDGVANLLGVVDGQVLYDISAAVLAGSPRRALEIVRDVDNQGYDIPTFAKALLEHFRNLVVAGVCQGDGSILDLPDEEFDELVGQASSVSTDTLHRLFKQFSESYDSIARSTYPRILLETTLARLADQRDLVPAAELVERLEKLVAAGGGSQPAGGPTTGSPSQGGSPVSQGPGNSREPRRTNGVSQGQGASEARPGSVAPLETVAGRDFSATAPQQMPKSAAPSPIPPSSGPPNVLQTVNWEREFAALKREKPSLASILECGVAVADDDNQGITIRYAEEYRAIAELAGERTREISNYLGARLARNVRVTTCLDKSTALPAVTRRRMELEELERQREDEARQHPLVRKVSQEFGGKIARVRLTSDSKNH